MMFMYCCAVFQEFLKQLHQSFCPDDVGQVSGVTFYYVFLVLFMCLYVVFIKF